MSEKKPAVHQDSGLFTSLQQLSEEGLELDALQHGGAGGQGARHGFLDKIHGPGGGLGEGLSPEKAAQEDGGKEVELDGPSP